MRCILKMRIEFINSYLEVSVRIKGNGVLTACQTRRYPYDIISGPALVASFRGLCLL